MSPPGNLAGIILAGVEGDRLRFVIDRGGVIRAVDADPDYTRRPEPAGTIEILRGLRS